MGKKGIIANCSYNNLDRLSYCNYNLIMITWDEPKRQSNIKDHGLDFAGCEAVFDSPVITETDAREAYGEQRINLIG